LFFTQSVFICIFIENFCEHIVDHEKLCAKREQEEKEIKEEKKREEGEKTKEESLRKAKEENERKDLEEREKIRHESEFQIQSPVVELKIVSKAKRELIVKDLVFNPSPIPSIKFQFSKRVLPSFNSIHFIIKSFKLFFSQPFCFPSHSLISSSSTSCVKTHFDSKILFQNHLSQSVRHCFCEVGLTSFSIFNSLFSQISHSILLHGHYDFNSILFDNYYRFVFYPGGPFNIVVVSLSQPS